MLSSVESKSLVRRFVLGGITLGVVGAIFYLTFQVISPFLGILVTSVIFAIFLNPIYHKMQTLTSKNNLSALITVLCLLFFIIFPTGLLLSSLVTEAVAAARTIQSDPEWIVRTQGMLESQVIAWRIPVEMSEINLQEQAYGLLSFLTRSFGTAAMRSGGVIIDLFFSLITIYFLLINQHKISLYLSDLNLFPKKYLRLIKSRIIEIVNGTVRSYLLVIVLQLVVGIAGFLFFQIPAAVLLGSLYGISSLLPFVGGILVFVPVAIWLLASGNLTAALLLSAWFLSISFVIENIVAPKIVGQNTKIHQLLILFSVFGGIQYFGLIGMVLGPVVIALAFIALSILKDFAVTDDGKSHEAI